MRHKNRTVDGLTIEELEQVIAERKQAASLRRLRHFERIGRRRSDQPLLSAASLQSVSFVSYWQGDALALRDRLLLAVEITAVLALVAMLAGLVVSLQTLNHHAEEAQ